MGASALAPRRSARRRHGLEHREPGAGGRLPSADEQVLGEQPIERVDPAPVIVSAASTVAPPTKISKRAKHARSWG
jgi:hypothetical protein